MTWGSSRSVKLERQSKITVGMGRWMVEYRRKKKPTLNKYPHDTVRISPSSTCALFPFTLYRSSLSILQLIFGLWVVGGRRERHGREPVGEGQRWREKGGGFKMGFGGWRSEEVGLLGCTHGCCDSITVLVTSYISNDGWTPGWACSLQHRHSHLPLWRHRL